MPRTVILRLHFDGARELEAVREGALDIACAALELDPRPTLVERGREPLPHPLGGRDGHTFRVCYDDGGELSLVQEVILGSGNARDGYGYFMKWELRVGEALVVKVGEINWTPQPKHFSATMSGAQLGAEAIDRARASLRARFGADNDRCDRLRMAVANAETLLYCGDEASARVLLARAQGWDEAPSASWVERANKLRARVGLPPRQTDDESDDESS